MLLFAFSAGKGLWEKKNKVKPGSSDDNFCNKRIIYYKY